MKVVCFTSRPFSFLHSFSPLSIYGTDNPCGMGEFVLTPQMSQRNIMSQFIEHLKFTWIYSQLSVARRDATSKRRAKCRINNTDLNNIICTHMWEMLFPKLWWSVYFIKYWTNWVTYLGEDCIFCKLACLMQQAVIWGQIIMKIGKVRSSGFCSTAMNSKRVSKRQENTGNKMDGNQ